MSGSRGPLSAEYLNPIIDEEMTWAVNMIDDLLKELYESGYPVGAKPLSQAEIYQNLVMLMQSGSPEFWQNPEAQDALNKLAGKFGAPPPMRAPQGVM